jgi:hypothetical protein
MGEFGKGFMTLVQCLYPSEFGSWWNQIGRIIGAVVVVGIWSLIGKGLIWLVT